MRKMTAKAGFPTLRLIRVSIGPFKLDHLKPGEAEKYISKKLKNFFGTMIGVIRAIIALFYSAFWCGFCCSLPNNFS